MWKKLKTESLDEISEDEIYNELEKVYNILDDIRDRLNRSTDIKLREKYMRPIVDFQNWLGYEI